MSSPFEFREIMKASMRYGETRTVEEVSADQERRHEEQARTRKQNKGRRLAPKKATTAPEDNSAKPVESDLDRMRKLMAAAPRRAGPVIDVESRPDE